MIANALDNKTEGNIYIKLTKLYVRKSLNQMAVTKKVINNNVSRYMTPIAKDTYTNIFGPAVTKRGRSLPPYEEVLYNASFVFANSHPLTDSLSECHQIAKMLVDIGLIISLHLCQRYFSN